MTPRIATFDGMDMFMNASVLHQPIHVYIVYDNVQTEIKIWTDDSEIEIEYPYGTNNLTGKQIKRIREVCEKNINIIEENWKVATGQTNGSYQAIYI